MRSRAVSIGLLVAAFVAACTTEPGIDGVPGLPYASASATCGPTDGPAVKISLAPRAFEGVQSPYLPSVQVFIWHPADSLAGRPWIVGAGDVVATYVFTAGDDELATGGRVTIDRRAVDGTLDGSVDLVFTRAGVLRGRFHAGWVERSVTCCG